MGNVSGHGQSVATVCAIHGTLFTVLTALSIALLFSVNWRPWRIYSWVYARRWAPYLQGLYLSIVSGLLSWLAWAIVVSPIAILIVWGVKLMLLLEHDTIGLAVIMAGTALVLAFYAIMLWWRTQWQSSRAVALLLLLAVALICSYEFCAVYVSAGRSASRRFSPSGFFFGVSAISMGINMLFICKMVFHGSGVDVDEYVRRSYKYAYADGIEVGPVAFLPEPPDPKDPSLRKRKRPSQLILLYSGSVLVLLVYSVVYALTAQKAKWLGGVTSAAVIILDSKMGVCMFGYKLLSSHVIALYLAGLYRIFLICFGVEYWYLGHCIGYAVVASVLLGAAVVRHFAVVNPSDARRAALQHTVVRLREGFRRRGLGSSSSFSEGRDSSAVRSSSVEGAHLVGYTDGSNRGESVHSWNAATGTGGNAADSMATFNPEKENFRGSAVALFAPGVSHQNTNDSASYQAGAEDADTSASSEEKQASSISSDATSPAPLYPEPEATCTGSVLCSGQELDSNSIRLAPADQQALDCSLALMLQERLKQQESSDWKRDGAEQDITAVLEERGLDPNFAVMLAGKGFDPQILALLQRSSLDADRDHKDNSKEAGGGESINVPTEEASTWSDELKRHQLEKWLQFTRQVIQCVGGTPERMWVLFSLVFVADTVIVAVFRPKPVSVISTSHDQFEFGIASLLLSPVICSIMAFLRALQAEDMCLTWRVQKFGILAWLLSTCVGLLLAILSKSSVLLGLSVTIPLLVASLVVALPIYVHNGYRFYMPPVWDYQDDESRRSHPQGVSRPREDIVMTAAICLCITCILALGTIISFEPLKNLRHHAGVAGINSSPYTSSYYLGWAVASALALLITGALPAVSWFATYRFTLSSAICVSIFIVVLVGFCGGSYAGVIHAREDQAPLKIDFLAALLPLLCIPAVFSLSCGLYKLKDECWKCSRGSCFFLGFGLLLLLGAISAVIATINPWMVGVAFLLFLLLVILTVGVVHHWVSHNFYLTRMEMFLVSLATFVLALASFLVGLLAGEPFVGASVGYFALLFLLGGRSLTVLLSPPVVIYSPRVLPVYVYDANSDTAKNVSSAFLMLYGIGLATAGWGVVASLEIYPPFAGASVSAVTLVVAFGFAVSRPCLTLRMIEDAVHFLSKDTIVQAIVRSSKKSRSAMSGTYSAPQRSASSAALLVGDTAISRDKAGNFVLPRADVLKLRERLRNEEHAAGLWWAPSTPYVCRQDTALEIGYRRKMCAHARILALEEAIDTEWVYMWDKFGGYLLLVLGLAARAEKVQDEVRLRLFLDSIGFSGLSAKKIKTWTPEDRKQFERVQESYMREKEIEEELVLQRREEEGRGRERRKTLLEKEERRRKEMEASVISSVPDVGTKEAAAMATAVRAVGADVFRDDSRLADQVSNIARRILTAHRVRRAQQTGVQGAVCVVDDEPRTGGRPCGPVHASLCGSSRVTISAAIVVQPESGPVYMFGSESYGQVCWEVYIAGAEQGLEAGQVGLRLVRGAAQTSTLREWNIGGTCIADGRWHTVVVTIDAEVGEVTAYLDGVFDGIQSGLPLPIDSGVWQEGTEIFVGMKPAMDVEAFGRSDSEGVESRMHIMDVFLWSRVLSEEEVLTVHASVLSDDLGALPEEEWWPVEESPAVDDWAYAADPLNIEAINYWDEGYWEEQQTTGRKRKAERETIALDMEYASRKLRKPKMETHEEVNQRMRAVELAVREALSARGEARFTDQEFPPGDYSLFVDSSNPLSKLQVVTEWERPDEVLKKAAVEGRPCLFSGTPNASDVCQGRLGNCWFLSAVAVLTEASRIKDVIITPEYNQEGIYTVRFCIEGEWVPVVVDDWIPCESHGKPAFATSKRVVELWVSILEKAYAKLHGSYEALEGGVVQDALVDLTGGAGEEIDMTSTQAQLDLGSGKLWSQLLRFKEEGFLLGAGSPSGSDAQVSANGIVQGHAYAVLQVREADGHKLVQIRNPWANEVEWNGPWSDMSPEWTDRMKHKLKYMPQSSDGIFWMSWEDFQLHFRSLYVCRIYPPEMRYPVRGQWRSASAGGCQEFETWHQNPQFHLRAVGADARHPIHVFVTLTQGVQFASRKRTSFDNYQPSNDSTHFYIGMRIIKTQGRRAGPVIFMHKSVGHTDYVNSREIACEMVLEPDPKGYTIVPTTYAPGQEAPFVLTVFTKATITLEPL